MATTDELLDALMKEYKKPEDFIGERGKIAVDSFDNISCQGGLITYGKIAIQPIKINDIVPEQKQKNHRRIW
jgi:hypothetical protein